MTTAEDTSTSTIDWYGNEDGVGIIGTDDNVTARAALQHIIDAGQYTLDFDLDENPSVDTLSASVIAIRADWKTTDDMDLTVRPGGESVPAVFLCWN